MALPGTILIAGPTASGKSALALAVAERHRRRHHQRRFHAGLSRSPHHHGAAERRRRRRGFRIGSTAMSMPPRIIRSGAGARTPARCSRRPEAQGGVPILVGGTGLYFKALTQGLVGGAADAARDPRRGAGPLRRRGRGRAARRTCPPRSRRWPSGSSPATGCGIARALEVLEATGRSLADWHRDGMPAILDPEEAVKIFLPSTAPSCTAGSTPASTPCWRPARWTR